MDETKLRQLFKKLSDCYADTWSQDGIGAPMIEGEIIQAMTEDRFLLAINEALRIHSVGGPASAMRDGGEQLSNEAVEKSVSCGLYCECEVPRQRNGNWCIRCNKQINRA